jgi:predicted metal-binding protein
MPQKIFMDLNTNQHGAALVAKYQSAMNAIKKSNNAPSQLNASMVARIHSLKPGCGSCGK